jgi:hypothetical protein
MVEVEGDGKMADAIAGEVGVTGGDAGTETPAGAKDKPDRREIKGGIPYSTSPGVLKKALELIIPAERPDKFGTNYMATILKLTGGAARAVPPFLKKMQFIGPDGAPTLLYSKFKTEGGRSQAAYEGLRNAFAELFRRNEYIHKADETSVKDTIVEITGLRKTDPIVRLMYASFDAVRSFIKADVSGGSEIGGTETSPEEGRSSDGGGENETAGYRLGFISDQHYLA